MPRLEKQRASSANSTSGISTSQSNARNSKRPHPKPKQQQQQQQQQKKASCLVCKFRRVKCDGARPTCGQCRQVKRACHGYPDDPQRGSVSSSAAVAAEAEPPVPSVTAAAAAPTLEPIPTGKQPSTYFQPASTEFSSSRSHPAYPAIKTDEGDIGVDFSSPPSHPSSDATALTLRTPPRTPSPHTSHPSALRSYSHSSRSSTLTSYPSNALSFTTDFSSSINFSSPVDQDEDETSAAVQESSSLLALYASPSAMTVSPEAPLIHMYRHRTIPALHPLSSGGVVGEWRMYIVQAVDIDKTLRYVASCLAASHDAFLTPNANSLALASTYYGKGLASMTAAFPRGNLQRSNSSSSAVSTPPPQQLDAQSLVHLMLSATVLLGVEFFRRNYGAIRMHLISIIKVLGERPACSMPPSLVLAERFFRRTYLYFSFFPSLHAAFSKLTREEVHHRTWLPDSALGGGGGTNAAAFSDFNEAEVALHDILWPWMFFQQALDRNPSSHMSPAAQMERNALARALDRWLQGYEEMLQLPFPAFPSSLSDTDTTYYDTLPTRRQVLADIYRLWATMIRIRIERATDNQNNLADDQIGSQRRYDAHIEAFRGMLQLAQSIDARMVRDTSISLEPVLGLQTVLFWIAVHCRDPAVRRAALDLVARAKVTHAQWYPPASVRVGMRVIGIEEMGWKARVAEEQGQTDSAADAREQRQGSVHTIKSGDSHSVGGNKGGARQGSVASQASSASAETGRQRSEASIGGIPDVKAASCAEDILEEDRLRNIRLHTDPAQGTVAIGYFCWYGAEVGWREKKEILLING